MRLRARRVRLFFAIQMVILGVVIAGRGIVEAAPLSFVLMGVLLAALGVLRIKTLRATTLMQDSNDERPEGDRRVSADNGRGRGARPRAPTDKRPSSTKGGR